MTNTRPSEHSERDDNQANALNALHAIRDKLTWYVAAPDRPTSELAYALCATVLEIANDAILLHRVRTPGPTVDATTLFPALTPELPELTRPSERSERDDHTANLQWTLRQGLRETLDDDRLTFDLHCTTCRQTLHTYTLTTTSITPDTLTSALRKHQTPHAHHQCAENALTSEPATRREQLRRLTELSEQTEHGYR